MALSETLENKKSDEKIEDPIEEQEDNDDEVKESEKDEQPEEHVEGGDPAEGGKVTLVKTEESAEPNGKSEEEERCLTFDESGKEKNTLNRYPSQESAMSTKSNVFSLEKGCGTNAKNMLSSTSLSTDPYLIYTADEILVAQILMDMRNDTFNKTAPLNPPVPSGKRLNCKKRSFFQAPIEVGDSHVNKKRKVKDCSGNIMRAPPEGIKETVRAMGGSHMRLVIAKILTNTDVNRGDNRLSMPFSRLATNSFLTEDEKERLGERCENGTNLKGMVVNLVDPDGVCRGGVTLKRWDMKKENSPGTSMFVLNNTWSTVVGRHKLCHGDNVEVWAFRVHSQLHLALAVS